MAHDAVALLRIVGNRGAGMRAGVIDARDVSLLISGDARNTHEQLVIDEWQIGRGTHVQQIPLTVRHLDRAGAVTPWERREQLDGATNGVASRQRTLRTAQDLAMLQ